MLTFPKDLDLDIEGIPVVRLALGITLYMAKPFSEMAEATLAAFERYRGVVGDENLRFYATDTMKKHAKVTTRALGMLPVWFAPDSPPRETFRIDFTDSEVYNGVPRCRFSISGDEEMVPGKRTWASVVHWSLDPAWGAQRPDDLLVYAQELCELFPFRCGHAGYVLNRSRYFPQLAADHAWAKAMRHPGIDLPDTILDGKTVGLDGVRVAGWLTMLDADFVSALGGLRNASLCQRLDVSRGSIIKAGPKPAIGDVNRDDFLPAYREAFHLIEGLTPRAFRRAPWLGLSDEGDGRTLAFLTRLAR